MKTDVERIINSLYTPKPKPDKDAMVGRRVTEDKRGVIVRAAYVNDVKDVGLFIGNLIIR